eukprot:gene7887-16145_t
MSFTNLPHRTNELFSPKIIWKSRVQSSIIAISDENVLHKWVRENGGFIGSIETTTSVTIANNLRSCEREVFSTSSIQLDELVLAIPRNCIITKSMGEKTCVGLLLAKSDQQLLNDGSYLTLVLFEEREKSKSMESNIYKNIMQYLPTITDLRHMPFYWNEEELIELTGSPLLELLSERRNSLSKDYITLCNISKTFQETVTQSEFSWIYSALISRTFTFNVESQYASALVVPIADMLNDAKDPDLFWDWDTDSDRFTLRATRAIATGLPLHISYGCIPNYARLFNYGYTMDQDLLDDVSRSPYTSSHQTKLQLELQDIIKRGKVIRKVFSVSNPQQQMQTERGGGGGGGGVGGGRCSSDEEVGVSVTEGELELAKVTSWLAMIITDHDTDTHIDTNGDIDTESDTRSISSTPAVQCQLSVGSVDSILAAMSLIRLSVTTESEMIAVMDRQCERRRGLKEEGNNDNGNENCDEKENDNMNEEGDADNDNDMESIAADSVCLQPISVTNEQVSLCVLMDIVDDCLRGYTTSFEDDAAYLLLHSADSDNIHTNISDNTTNSNCINDDDIVAVNNIVNNTTIPLDTITKTLLYNKRNAIICRMGEKKVLLHHKHILNGLLQFIQLQLQHDLSSSDIKPNSNNIQVLQQPEDNLDFLASYQ